MALILNKKYVFKNSLMLFYTNRIFRLMPLYLFFLIASVSISYLCLKLKIFPFQSKTLVNFFNHMEMFDTGTILYLLFSNIFVLGHELYAFLGINPADGKLFFTSSWTTTHHPMVWTLFFIPQSWTLAMEFYFYLIAPFIVRRKRIIIGIMLCSFIMRYYIYSMGYQFLPWPYGFFPTELSLFMLGALSYHFYIFLDRRNFFSEWNSLIIMVIIVVMTFGYPFLPQTKSFTNFFDNAQMIYYLSVALGLPFLFHKTKNAKMDRFMGELSYPVYLSHLIVIPFFGAPFIIGKSARDIFLILMFTILFSALAHIFIQEKIEGFRQKRFYSQSQANKADGSGVD